MSTIVKENYLKALYFLNEETSSINLTELSKKLAVSKPTANNMIKSLEGEGWVVYQKYKPIQLTESGRLAAAMVIRKHRLTELFLYKFMEFGWEEVHEIAEQMEHITSPKLFARMDEMLDYPSIDPHGSPIPDKNGNVLIKDLRLLNDIALGQKVRLASIVRSSKELLDFLNERHIKIGSILQLIKIEPFDKSCWISLDGKSPIVITSKVSQHLLVEEI